MVHVIVITFLLYCNRNSFVVNLLNVLVACCKLHRLIVDLLSRSYTAS